jgi:hypothetical protein
LQRRWTELLSLEGSYRVGQGARAAAM